MTVGEFCNLVEEGRKKLGDAIWNMELSSAIILWGIIGIFITLYLINASKDDEEVY